MGLLDKILSDDSNSADSVIKFANELVDTSKNLSSKTHLNHIQVVTISNAERFSKRYFCDVLQDYTTLLKENLISLDRKGRGELVEGLGSAFKHDVEMNRPKVTL